VFSVHVKYAFVLQEFLNYNFNYGAMTTSVCALSLISKQYALNTTIIKKQSTKKHQSQHTAALINDSGFKVL